MTRVSFLVMSDFERLEEWCRLVEVCFEPAFGPYLVGSVLTKRDYRDVDVRVMVDDKAFDRRYRSGFGKSRWPLRIRYLNRAFSIWGQAETGLPIDFQIQRVTEANAEYPQAKRVPMGLRDWQSVKTSGVPA